MMMIGVLVNLNFCQRKKNKTCRKKRNSFWKREFARFDIWNGIENVQPVVSFGVKCTIPLQQRQTQFHSCFHLFLNPSPIHFSFFAFFRVSFTFSWKEFEVKEGVDSWIAMRKTRATISSFFCIRLIAKKINLWRVIIINEYYNIMYF